MSVVTAVALALVVIGAVTNATGLVLLGVLAGLQHGISSIWSRHGLDRVSYERQLGSDRAVWDDLVEISVTIENRKVLPLAWVRADDQVTGDAELGQGVLVPSERSGFWLLQNTWTLAPFERIRRITHVRADRRGRWRFDVVRLSVADIFGWGASEREERHDATLLVRPRTVPVRTATGAIVPEGSRRARVGLLEDPALFAGVRPFRLGDARRRIHQRATARVGRPMSKQFEPATTRTVLIALDMQTSEGPYWVLRYDEDLVETLAVVAGSLARRLLSDGAACGITVNGWTYTPSTVAFVAPRAGDEHLTAIADVLARMSSVASTPFERVLGTVPVRLPPGALIMTVSSRDPASIAPSLRRLRANGFDVRHVAVGPRAADDAVRARRAGINSVSGHLTPDWRRSDALVLVG